MTFKKTTLLVMVALLALSAWSSMASASAADALTETAWEGEYYDNYWFAGEPALIRDDAALAFDWGEGAPVEGLSADNNSIKWRKEVSVEAPTTLRFSGSADAQMQLMVNSQPVLASADGAWVSAEVELKQGKNWFYVEYKETTGSASISLSYEVVGQAAATPTVAVPTPAPTPTPSPEPVEVYQQNESDWAVTYFDNTEFAGEAVTSATLAGINLNWGYKAPVKNVPADNFSVRLSKTISVSAEAVYDLSVITTDRVRVLIDNRPIMSADGNLYRQPHQAGMPQKTNSAFALQAGVHTLTVEHADVVPENSEKNDRFASLSILLLPVELGDESLPEGIYLSADKSTISWDDTANLQFGPHQPRMSNPWVGSTTYPYDGSFQTAYESGDTRFIANDCQFKERHFYLYKYIAGYRVIIDSIALSNQIDPWFFTLDEGADDAALGNACVLGDGKSASVQRFENGKMVWIQSPQGFGDLIYVLVGDGADDTFTKAFVFNDKWTEDDAIRDPMVTPPAGLLQPEYGFGKIWRENLDVRSMLGWAVAHSDDFTTTYQMTMQVTPTGSSSKTVSEFFLIGEQLLQIDRPRLGYNKTQVDRAMFVGYDLR